MESAPAVRRAHHRDEILDLVGHELGPTRWLDLSADKMTRFNGLGEAVSQLPTLTTTPMCAVAYSLSWGPQLSATLLSFEGFRHGLNYGFDRIEYLSDISVGSRFRMRLTLLSCHTRSGGLQIAMKQAFEQEGVARPFCIAVALTQLFQ